MTRDNHARRHAVRTYMTAHNVTYTQALRAIQNPETTAAREDSPPVVERPRVEVVSTEPIPQGQIDGWGRIERIHDGWLITPVSYQNAIEYGLAHQVRVDHRDPIAGKPASVELPAVVRRQDASALGTATGQWTWAAKGWAVDEPGDIAEAPATPAPSAELPYQVRGFWCAGRHRMFLRDWNGSKPNWYTLAWCPTLADATEIAYRNMRHDTEDGRVSVWGPSPDNPTTRQVLLIIDPPATPDSDLPRPRPDWLPATPRPISPPPDPEPVWVDSARIDPSVVALADHPRYSLRAWNPTDGWRTIAWTHLPFQAAEIADILGIGVVGCLWFYGDICGPGENDDDDPRVLRSHIPDISPQERTPDRTKQHMTRKRRPKRAKHGRN